MSFAVINNFLSLIYPDCCACCGQDLFRGEDCICLLCEAQLPQTNFHDYDNNPVEKTLYGRCEYDAATAFLYFSKKGMVHRMLYELKYNDNTSVGVKMGELFGKKLKKSKRFSSFDYIIPVPLHPKKERKRGYNQAMKLAEGINQSFQAKLSKGHLIRNRANSTQTKKNRWQRWENVASIFEVRKPEVLENKKVLLIDDVITTGATIEACAQALSTVKGLQLSVACLAVPLN